MSLPDLLAETAGDESVVAEVSLGGDDRLAVTPTRTLVYRSDGLLSDESVAEYPHDVERISVSTGRRKAKLTLGYGLDGDETISLPAKRVDEALHPILAGVLSATGVTDPGESVVRTFRFSELTLVVTSDRLVKHVGSAVWDEEFEEFPYADLTDLDFEEGTVATAVVLAHGGRSERFKAPNEAARAVRETLVDAVCAYHDVDSLEEFRVTVADDESGADADTESPTDFGEGPDPLSASPVADAEAEAEAGAGAESGAEAVADIGASGATESTTADERAGDADPLAAGVEDADAVDRTPVTDAQPAAGGATEAVASSDGARESTDALSDDESLDADPLDAGPLDADRVGETDAERGGDASATRPEDAFDGSPFESAGVEGDDLATEVAALRRTVEEQSERLDRQSTLIERLIEELRRGR
ncbi:hypothetical protein U4E84_15690 [Halorubrum sp. AD140]|uniref:DUF7115 domain-containing protein n=1 Tax=Halorubrum sp. AD140 TaxID=3050073 RepID=UPI002ACC98C8|nr:hypothetical protein [Halorubrum sp. AD140]MDZ5812787.1 hypothetical protein [Halorubrum sp. AD140]